MSQYYNFWKMCYDNRWVTVDQVKQAVVKNAITAEEYATITGQAYVA